MKFKIDENLPHEVAQALRAAGHDAETAGDEGLAGAPDPQLLSACQAEGRALVTLDLDFSNVVAYPPEQHAGLLVLRPDRQSKPLVLDLVTRVLIPLLEHHPVSGKLWIVEATRVRVQP